MVLGFFKDKISNMGREDFEVLFLVITGVIASLALLCIAIILCRTRCCRRRGDSDARHRAPLIKTSDGVPLDTTDIDYIDSKDTKVISSAVQVKSLHNSPNPA